MDTLHVEADFQHVLQGYCSNCGIEIRGATPLHIICGLAKDYGNVEERRYCTECQDLFYQLVMSDKFAEMLKQEVKTIDTTLPTMS